MNKGKRKPATSSDGEATRKRKQWNRDGSSSAIGYPPAKIAKTDVIHDVPKATSQVNGTTISSTEL